VASFFERCGYQRIEKAELPHKIWNECVRCPLFPNCNEIALIRTAAPQSLGAAVAPALAGSAV
jgi:amino-acid N-acetyltransferase